MKRACICTDTFVRGCEKHDVVAGLQASMRRIVRLHEEGGPTVCCDMAEEAASAVGDELGPGERGARTPTPDDDARIVHWLETNDTQNAPLTAYANLASLIAEVRANERQRMGQEKGELQAALSEAISRCGDESVYDDLHRKFGHLLARPTSKDPCISSSSSSLQSAGSSSEASSSIASHGEPATSNPTGRELCLLLAARELLSNARDQGRDGCFDDLVDEHCVEKLRHAVETYSDVYDFGGWKQVHPTANPFPGYKPVEMVDREELRERYAKPAKEKDK